MFDIFPTRYAEREPRDMFTTGPSPASAAEHSSEDPCRTRLQRSTSADERAPARSMSRRERTVNTAGNTG